MIDNERLKPRNSYAHSLTCLLQRNSISTLVVTDQCSYERNLFTNGPQFCAAVISIALWRAMLGSQLGISV